MRTWKVAHHKEETKKGFKITEYFVTDAGTNDELSDRPVAAAFPVSQKFDNDHQEKRAEEYAEYLNRINEAATQAYENNRLLDILKTP